MEIDSVLLQPIHVSLPIWRKYSAVPKIAGYSSITSITPCINEFLATTLDSEGQLQSDELFGAVRNFEKGNGSCTVITATKKQRDAYCKVTHLLDPIRTIQGFYANTEKGERRKFDKLNNPMNQAYIDALGNYLLGQLRERNISPHFCLYYGGFKAIANTYRFNISDEFDSYRKYKSFWSRRRQGLFKLHIELDEDVKGEINTPTSTLHSARFSYQTPNSVASELEPIEINVCDDDLGSLKSFCVNSADERENNEDYTEEDREDEEGEGYEDEDEEESEQIYAEFSEYPVMLIFQERMEGVLDDLLEDDEEQGTESWEIRWAAWLFQIISALCCAQGVLGFTHNDLHTNNIVWTETDKEFLFYRNRAGNVWKIPTFGKIFRLIDFGRAVFRVGEKWFRSDDYEIGGDAEGQYNLEKLCPNPSFDLARLSVSLIESLFPTPPSENLDGAILNQEDDWTVYETESPLYNLLWSWLIDDSGKNILRDEDYTERFPDFDLYIHIASHVFGAKPQEQVGRDIFKQFSIAPLSISETECVYPLFC